MAPQLYISMYAEQFCSPGRGEPAKLRPTSAHRRNNPHPRPDFLFPRSLRLSHASSRAVPRPSPPVDTGRPLFPPVRPSSFRSLNTACPDKPVDAGDKVKHTQHMPSVLPSTIHALPSAGCLQKLQLTPPGSDLCGELPSKMDLVKCPQTDHQRNVEPLSHTQEHRRLPGAPLLARPHAGASPAQQHHRPQNWRPRCSAWTSGSGYACFHVVKPYRVGHYVIHPEFVSECLG